MIIVTQKPNCKASCKSPHLLIMMLAYVVVIDACDDYCRLQSKLITMKALKRFYKVVRECFEFKYLL
jgi:hypothetical protein